MERRGKEVNYTLEILVMSFVKQYTNLFPEGSWNCLFPEGPETQKGIFVSVSGKMSMILITTLWFQTPMCKNYQLKK